MARHRCAPGQGRTRTFPGPRRARPSATRSSATRRARSGSSGQPHATRTRDGGTGPRRKASTRRPRPCRSEPSKRVWRERANGRVGHPWCGVEPGAAARQRAPAARRGTSRAQRRPELHERLVPLPCPSRRHQRVRQGLGGTRRQRRPGHGPGEHPRHVDVHDRLVPLEGEDQDGPRRVRPDTGKRTQGLQVRRHDSPVPFANGLCRLVEMAGTSVVAEPGPRVERRRRGRLPRRPTRWETARGSGHRGRRTRRAWVCCSITSLTSTAHGSRVSRHGNGRKPDRPTRSTARRIRRRTGASGTGGAAVNPRRRPRRDGGAPERTRASTP